MNYRHQFHAGNFADVMKHALLVRLMRALQKKETGFLFVDTHAGRGRYDLAAEVFALSLEKLGLAPALESLGPVARALGRSIARDAHPRPRRQEPVEHGLHAVLEACGFEPQSDGDRLWLRNCPFDVLTRAHRALVCGTSLELVRGILQGLGVRSLSARIDPRPGRCCVMVRGLNTAEAGNVVTELARPA